MRDFEYSIDLQKKNPLTELLSEHFGKDTTTVYVTFTPTHWEHVQDEPQAGIYAHWCVTGVSVEYIAIHLDNDNVHGIGDWKTVDIDSLPKPILNAIEDVCIEQTDSGIISNLIQQELDSVMTRSEPEQD